MSLVSRYLEPELVERLNHLQLTARSVVEGSTIGLHLSHLKGASIEFRQHRAYVAGDEPRRLDWRVLARTDRPFIKEYDEETNLRCVLMLDCSGSMAYTGKGASKFDYAAKLVASLAYLMLGQTEAVGLALVGKKLDQWIAPAGGPSQLSRVMETLDRASPRGEAGLAAATHEVADRIGRRALVIVISDFFSSIASIQEGLSHLRHDRHEIICPRVLDQDELEFPFRAWSRFRGMEGEAAYLCEPSLVRKTYMENFTRHQRQFRETCRSVGAACHEFVTDRPLMESLTKMIRSRRQDIRGAACS